MQIRIRQKPDRETWLTWRLGNSNASEAGAHLRCHDYCSQMQMFHEKRSGLTQASTRIMERGLDLEAAVIAMVARERPEWRVEACNDYYDAPDLRIGCSPDAFAWSGEWEGRANLQIKVIARRVFEEKWRNEDGNVCPPIFYQIQTLQEAKLTRASRNFLAVYVIEEFPRDDEPNLHILEIPIHEGAWAAVLRETAAFWQAFDAGIEPAPEGAKDLDFIKRLYPTDDGNIVDLAGDNELPEALDAYKELSGELSELNKPVSEVEKKREAWAALIQNKLGAASGAVLPGWEITWKSQERKACQFRQFRIKQVGAR